MQGPLDNGITKSRVVLPENTAVTKILFQAVYQISISSAVPELKQVQRHVPYPFPSRLDTTAALGDCAVQRLCACPRRNMGFH